MVQLRRPQRATAGARWPALVLAVLFLAAQCAVRPAEARRPTHIPDELNDVLDDEEDADWKEWGKTSADRPRPPIDFSPGKMDLKAVMDSQLSGHQLAFTKLKPDPKRDKVDATRIAGYWTELLKTGHLAETQFFVQEPDVFVVSVKDGRKIMEVKDFVLARPESLEFDFKSTKYRRPGEEEPPSPPPVPETPPPAKKMRSKKKVAPASAEAKAVNAPDVAPAADVRAADAGEAPRKTRKQRADEKAAAQAAAEAEAPPLGLPGDL